MAVRHEQEIERRNRLIENLSRKEEAINKVG